MTDCSIVSIPVYSASFAGEIIRRAAPISHPMAMCVKDGLHDPRVHLCQPIKISHIGEL
jgi:hypothetical protein